MLNLKFLIAWSTYIIVISLLFVFNNNCMYVLIFEYWSLVPHPVVSCGFKWLSIPWQDHGFSWHLSIVHCVLLQMYKLGIQLRSMTHPLWSSQTSNSSYVIYSQEIQSDDSLPLNYASWYIQKDMSMLQFSMDYFVKKNLTIAQ